MLKLTWKWTCRQVLTVIWWKKSWKDLVWHLAFRSKLKWHKRWSEILKPTGFQHETVPSLYFNFVTWTGIFFFFLLFSVSQQLLLCPPVFMEQRIKIRSTFHLKNKFSAEAEQLQPWKEHFYDQFTRGHDSVHIYELATLREQERRLQAMPSATVSLQIWSAAFEHPQKSLAWFGGVSLPLELHSAEG